MNVQLVSTDKAPAAIGPYSQATIAGGFLFTAGQIPLDPATMEIVTGDIEPQTRQVIANLREGVTGQLMRVEVVQQPPEDQAQQLPYMEAHKIDPFTGEDEMAYADATLSPAMAGGNGAQRAIDRDPNNPATWGKVGRNEVCPCGSGKKYKHCHGRFG